MINNKSNYCPVCIGHKKIQLQNISNQHVYVSTNYIEYLEYINTGNWRKQDVFCENCGLKFHVDSIKGD